MQWGYTVNKQQINAEQTPKTEHRPAAMWEIKAHEQRRGGAGSLKHSNANLWHTFAPNQTDVDKCMGQ